MPFWNYWRVITPKRKVYKPLILKLYYGNKKFIIKGWGTTVIKRTNLTIIIKMCLQSEKIYNSDQEFLDQIKDRMGLKSRAMALRIIIRKFKQLKLHLDLEDIRK